MTRGRWWLLLGLTIAALVVIRWVWPVPTIDDGAAQPPEVSPFMPGQLAEYIAALSAEDRGDYVLLQVVDIPLIALYAIVLIAGTRLWVSTALQPFVAAASIAAVVADLAEDALITWSVLAFPGQPEVLDGLFVGANLIKWIGLLAFLPVIGFALVRQFRQGEPS